MDRVLSLERSRGIYDSGWLVSKRICFSSVFSVGFLALLGGVLLGRYSLHREMELRSQTDTVQVGGTTDDVASLIVQDVRVESIHRLIKTLTDKSDESWNHRQAELIRQHFKEQGFDIVSPIQSSAIMLTYANPDRQNTVLIVDKRDSLYNCTHLVKESPFKQNVKLLSKVVEGDLVYINFGRDTDYDVLKMNNIAIENKIVLARLGTSSPLELVFEALRRGVAGVLLFADPQQYAGAVDASLWPLFTPAQMALLHLLNSENIHEDVQSEDMSSAECVPVQVVSAEYAKRLFEEMKTDQDERVPEDWRGDLSEYHFQSSQTRLSLRLEVNTVSVERRFYNVIAGIKGVQEPDRYVMVSSSRNSVEGGDHAKYSGGSAAMMELARVFNMLRTTRGWRPRRSMLFFSWGLALAEAHYTSPLISDDWLSVLDNTEVAYVSVNAPVTGNEMLLVHSSPLMFKVLRDASALVPNPSPAEVAAGRTTLADSWQQLANITLPDSDDFMHTMIHNEGIPGIDFSFTNSKSQPGDLADPELRYLKAVTQLWGVLLVRLAESPAVPFSPLDYADFLNHSLATTEGRFSYAIQSHALHLDQLRAAISELRAAAVTFQGRMEHAESLDQLQLRILNDQLLQFEAMFVNSESYEDRLALGLNRHTVLEPPKELSEPVVGFGRLQELLNELLWMHDTTSLKEYISLLTISVERAKHRLTGPLNLPSS
ncbi:putative N-acetylated-alpha-linked acidic dipeptidase isoform X2 [Bacillus rossius redtenbacheri]|uniref:putative N-acetylated-alpha-linked acidic dipeptidase isoform X2 n=1 Tax=Bacillus rossius redtenbacheri TaxID=93214 RepID=UPI002FDD39ED